MPAIKSCGAYVPFYRLKREEIARAWGGGAPKGEKAVANYDEDSITMAVEAGRDALKGIDRQSIDGLYFASTTTPYKEKQSAAVIAAALDLKRNVLTADFTNSLRSGTIAVRAAIDAVKAGSAKNVLVVAADCRLGTPGSEFEQAFGDGAAALLVSDEGGIVFDSSYTHADEIIEQWRVEGQAFVKAWEDRFGVTQGYLANVREAVSAFLKQTNSSIQDFTRVVLYAPDNRKHQEACRALKLDLKNQVQNCLYDSVGNTGTALTLMMLVAALEEASVNDKILVINYGDGCDLFVLQVKEKLPAVEGRRGVKGHLESKKYIDNYEKYIRTRKLMEVETGRRRPPLVSSAPVLRRDRNMVLALHASECTSCGRRFFPPQRVCLYCMAKDQFKEIGISEQKGRLFTFCKDILAQSIDPPVVISVVDLEGGLRFYGQMTDREPEKIEVNMPVELTFRRFSEAEGFYNYFWKCRPVR